MDTLITAADLMVGKHATWIQVAVEVVIFLIMVMVGFRAMITHESAQNAEGTGTSRLANGTIAPVRRSRTQSISAKGAGGRGR